MGKSKMWGVTRLEVDRYEGNRNKRIATDSPTLSDATKAIKSLNGGSQSSLCLIGSDNSVFCVGGGPDRYHVSITLTDSVHVLCDLDKTDQPIDVIIGAIHTPLPEKFVVNEDPVLTAVAKYFRDGTLAPSLKWVEC